MVAISAVTLVACMTRLDGTTRPKFVHLPLILKPVGKGKLSKRDGDKFGFPVFAIQWEKRRNS